MAKFIEELKHTSAVQLFRQLSSIAAALVFMWMFSGPFIKAYAADAFKEMLIEQGVDPQTFAEIQRQVGEIADETGTTATDLGKAKEDIGTLQSDVEVIKKDTSDIEKLLTTQSQDIKALLRAVGPAAP